MITSEPQLQGYVRTSSGQDHQTSDDLFQHGGIVVRGQGAVIEKIQAMRLNSSSDLLRGFTVITIAVSL